MALSRRDKNILLRFGLKDSALQTPGGAPLSAEREEPWVGEVLRAMDDFHAQRSEAAREGEAQKLNLTGAADDRALFVPAYLASETARMGEAVSQHLPEPIPWVRSTLVVFTLIITGGLIWVWYPGPQFDQMSSENVAALFENTPSSRPATGRTVLTEARKESREFAHTKLADRRNTIPVYQDSLDSGLTALGSITSTGVVGSAKGGRPALPELVPLGLRKINEITITSSPPGIDVHLVARWAALVGKTPTVVGVYEPTEQSQTLYLWTLTDQGQLKAVGETPKDSPRGSIECRLSDTRAEKQSIDFRVRRTVRVDFLGPRRP